NPGCNTTDIVAQTEISLSTVERCLSELRKRKLVKYVGSKRHGGYHAMPATNDGSATAAPSR
ncbi:MAG: helix-turn-helix domain-containing protein, partial [Bacteroidales bacterium]|nr:helix-turn-helix domain-containing protein [Bacteroidales bacterium]